VFCKERYVNMEHYSSGRWFLSLDIVTHPLKTPQEERRVEVE